MSLASTMDLDPLEYATGLMTAIGLLYFMKRMRNFIPQGATSCFRALIFIPNISGLYCSILWGNVLAW
ncbi:hypothetical protein BGW36DRAFT_59366 [Talaromyces proteolyticus]|uniref:Uncharacterized protein n=1 Tax=Talaromyces proteolyticus TaxID=1131652 RepID=A0AAD4KGR6_9EURO|nr:uncharacterized protein BGW36DRAFT_59366 [Talaromyces proteolyticus]KAH8690755.1 hypothetical protein BGW36DRAFT_59366 [Talaromyces proteolyticus]